ncbi:hypothetical protein K0M31_000784 [Melipona bicolor]|uniref:Uncharacterized protein n=1 Tax=Melipona bicolor TaxID=60889 RepID=A0AA40KX11_9HYME|nr:hypothetical protein K0M31_000784 [Melipona bicolor]
MCGFACSQDRWKSGGDGPDAHLQEDQKTEGQDGGHLSQGTVAVEGDREGGPGRNQRVSVPVS